MKAGELRKCKKDFPISSMVGKAFRITRLEPVPWEPGRNKVFHNYFGSEDWFNSFWEKETILISFTYYTKML